ncbi:MAG: HEAT repeat domain-containing protein [Planctomycetes bacterium]|nr:HEAT repeat domain-containing protein [Planctomycetota bacterium]
MTLAVSLLLLSFLPPLPQGPIKLPPRPTVPGTAAPAPPPPTELERFRRDLQELTGSVAKIENELVEIGRRYAQLEPLVLEVARTARGSELGFLMLVARRYGTEKTASELEFQLLTRPLGDTTRPVAETMVFLLDQQRGDARRALQNCVRGRVPGARRPAAELLAQRATAEDLPFALELASDASLDLQLRGVDLLRAVPAPAARERLVQLLSKDPALAAGACAALIALQQEAVPHLRKLLAEPPIDRGYCYAAFALAQIGDAAGQLLLDDGPAPALLRRLAEPEALARSLAAVPLADLAHASRPGGQVAWRDADVVEALLDVVDGRQYVPNLDLLRRPAEQRLVRLTGRLAGPAEPLPWREWWKDQRGSFVGIRAEVEVAGQGAATAVIALRQEQQFVRLVAEGLADSAPLPGALEILLTAPQVLDLVQQLRAGGFADPAAMRSPAGLPLVRSLQLQVPGARMQVAMPAGEHAAFDALVATVQRTIDAELWQLYRHPQQEPDRAAFWRAERQWREANPDPVRHGRRFVARVLGNWAALTPALRARALEHLFARSDRRNLFGEADGEAMLAIVRSAPALGELELHLLELAAGVGGDRVWRECVDVAARAQGGGRNAVRAVFAVLGPDAVLAALDDVRSVVRRVAVEEAELTRDPRAAPKLVALLSDLDPEVARAAAHACGHLQIAAAGRPLIAAVVAETTPPLVRRECLRALGRVGGEQAFTVLERAVTAPQQEDREAALRGLGELRDVRSAFLLAELAVAGHGKEVGLQARFHLQRLGGILAVPALRHQLQVVRDPAIRAQFVLLLGGYQDALAIPDLIDLLRQPAHALEAAAALAGTTGVDVQGVADRIGGIEAWYRKNKQAPQWQWLLDALQAGAVPTTLRAEQFAAAAGLQALPELARLLAEAAESRYWVLASAVLRTVANVDFGAVGHDTPADVRKGIAARYRLLVEQQATAQGR